MEEPSAAEQHVLEAHVHVIRVALGVSDDPLATMSTEGVLKGHKVLCAGTVLLRVEIERPLKSVGNGGNGDRWC